MRFWNARCRRVEDGRREAVLVATFPISGLTRWDEKAGLRGMRYAPNVSTCSRHKKKETGDEED